MFLNKRAREANDVTSLICYKLNSDIEILRHEVHVYILRPTLVLFVIFRQPKRVWMGVGVSG